MVQGDTPESRIALLKNTLEISASGGKLLLAEPYPGEGTTLAGILPPGVLEDTAEHRFIDCEKAFLESFFAEQTPEPVEQLVDNAGWNNVRVDSCNVSENRLLAESLLDSWLSASRKGSYGAEMAALMGKAEWEETAVRIKAILAGRTVHWETALITISASS